MSIQFLELKPAHKLWLLEDAEIAAGIYADTYKACVLPKLSPISPRQLRNVKSGVLVKQALSTVNRQSKQTNEFYF